MAEKFVLWPEFETATKIGVTISIVAAGVTYAGTGMLAAISYFVLLFALPFAFFNGSTWIAVSLKPATLYRFQIAVAIIAPAILSIYFLKDATEFQLGNALSLLSGWGGWLFCGINILIGKGAGSIVDRQYPYRGFIMASFVMFMLLMMGEAGAFHGDDYDYEPKTPEELFVSDNGGRFGQYWIYVACLYAGMLYTLRRERRYN